MDNRIIKLVNEKDLKVTLASMVHIIKHNDEVLELLEDTLRGNKPALILINEQIKMNARHLEGFFMNDLKLADDNINARNVCLN